MHCTVKPGKYCMRTPQWPASSACAGGNARGGVSPGRPGPDLMAQIVPPDACGVKGKYYKGLW